MRIANQVHLVQAHQCHKMDANKEVLIVEGSDRNIFRKLGIAIEKRKKVSSDKDVKSLSMNVPRNATSIEMFEEDYFDPKSQSSVIEQRQAGFHNSTEKKGEPCTALKLFHSKKTAFQKQNNTYLDPGKKCFYIYVTL